MVLPFRCLSSWLWRGNPKSQNHELNSNGNDTSSNPNGNNIHGHNSRKHRKSKGARSRSRPRVRKRDEKASVLGTPSCDALMESSQDPSDSDSGGSDWSIGWFEPHPPNFCNEEEPDNSFAVLVPCYASSDGHGLKNNRTPAAATPSSSFDHVADPKSQLWATVIADLAKDAQSEAKHHLQKWLSSLQG